MQRQITKETTGIHRRGGQRRNDRRTRRRSAGAASVGECRHGCERIGELCKQQGEERGRLIGEAAAEHDRQYRDQKRYLQRHRPLPPVSGSTVYASRARRALFAAGKVVRACRPSGATDGNGSRNRLMKTVAGPVAGSVGRTVQRNFQQNLCGAALREQTAKPHGCRSGRVRLFCWWVKLRQTCIRFPRQA